MSGEKSAFREKRTWQWAVLAVVTLGWYVSGMRELRRAALRGALAAAAATAVSRLDRRVQPDAARAAAFATGAVLESGTAGAPLTVAALVSIADDTRRHGPGSLVGAAAGAAFAVGSTRLWPVPPALAPAAPKVDVPQRLEPSPDGAGLTIVVNEASGTGSEEVVEELERSLPHARILTVDPVDGDDLRSSLQRAVDEGATALGVAGGDGSINTAAAVALDNGKPLMVVPSGTFNHLTGAIGIEGSADAVEAVRKGEALEIDVASIDGHVFLNTASFGSYVELVDARERLEERIGKWPAVVVALIRVLRRAEPLRVRIDDQERRVWMAFIGNCRYHPSGFAPSWRERLDDQMLDFRYVSGTEPWARARLVAAVLTGRLGRSRVYREQQVRKLSLRGVDGPLRLARDGETFEGAEEVVVCKRDKRLLVFAPHRSNP